MNSFKTILILLSYALTLQFSFAGIPPLEVAEPPLFDQFKDEVFSMLEDELHPVLKYDFSYTEDDIEEIFDLVDQVLDRHRDSIEEELVRLASDHTWDALYGPDLEEPAPSFPKDLYPSDPLKLNSPHNDFFDQDLGDGEGAGLAMLALGGIYLLYSLGELIYDAVKHSESDDVPSLRYRSSSRSRSYFSGSREPMDTANAVLLSRLKEDFDREMRGEGRSSRARRRRTRSSYKPTIIHVRPFNGKVEYPGNLTRQNLKERGEEVFNLIVQDVRSGKIPSHRSINQEKVIAKVSEMVRDFKTEDQISEAIRAEINLANAVLDARNREFYGVAGDGEVKREHSVLVAELYNAQGNGRVKRSFGQDIDLDIVNKRPEDEMFTFQSPGCTDMEKHFAESLISVELSPRCAYREKSEVLYSKLRHTKPASDVGGQSRYVGLMAIEVGDEEYSLGNKESAQLAYHVGETMADLSIGVVPYVGTGKDVYEFVFGRHLLTGRKLSAFERGMSFVGVSLSSMSGGVVNTSSMKLAFQNSNRFLGKINFKLIQKSDLKPFSSFKPNAFGKMQGIAMKEYGRVGMEAIRKMGLQSKAEMQMGARFLNRAFSGVNPSKYQLDRVGRVITKRNITDYFGVLERYGLRDNVFAQELLARQMVTKSLGKRMLGRVGQVYVKGKGIGAEAVTEVKDVSLWRVVPMRRGAGKAGQSLGAKGQDDVFQFHKNMGLRDQRFSPKGRKGLFTSFDRDTALREFKHHYPDQSFIISSRKISLDKVLDLTDPKVLKKLGVTKKEITQDLRRRPDAYLIPNIIREAAQEQGFKGIKFPSAMKKANGQSIGDNLVIFDELAK